jgi:hypothetical protein
MRSIQTQNRSKFSGNTSRNHEANLLNNSTNLEMHLKSSHIKIGVYLTYGKNSKQFIKFTTFHEKCHAITSALSRATPDTWNVIDKSISKQLNQVIDPLINEVESVFVSGTQFGAIFKDLFNLDFPAKIASSRHATKEAIR